MAARPAGGGQGAEPDGLRPGGGRHAAGLHRAGRRGRVHRHVRAAGRQGRTGTVSARGVTAVWDLTANKGIDEGHEGAACGRSGSRWSTWPRGRSTWARAGRRLYGVLRVHRRQAGHAMPYRVTERRRDPDRQAGRPALGAGRRAGGRRRDPGVVPQRLRGLLLHEVPLLTAASTPTF